jgi:predicted GIY-YIG superfamily endonuclease
MTKLSWPIDMPPPKGSGIVYLMTLPHGKRYIGATKNSATYRLYFHLKAAKKSNTNLHKSLRSQNYQATIEVIEVVPLASLFEREAALIMEYGTFGVGGLNSTPGGEGVVSTLPEAEDRRVAGMKKTMASDGYKENQRRVQAEAWTEGLRKKRSDETKARWADPAYRAAALVSRRKPRNVKPRDEPFVAVDFPREFLSLVPKFRKKTNNPISGKPNITVKSWHYLPVEFSLEHTSFLGWKVRDFNRAVKHGWLEVIDAESSNSQGHKSQTPENSYGSDV